MWLLGWDKCSCSDYQQTEESIKMTSKLLSPEVNFILLHLWSTFLYSHSIQQSFRQDFHSNFPKTSDSRNIKMSSSPRVTLVPPYSGSKTLSPALKHVSCRVPVTSRSPGPTATTSPSLGSFVESVGRYIPLAVWISLGALLTSTLSPSGVSFRKRDYSDTKGNCEDFIARTCLWIELMKGREWDELFHLRKQWRYNKLTRVLNMIKFGFEYCCEDTILLWRYSFSWVEMRKDGRR